MQVTSKYNKGIRYLLCAIDLFSKYAWVIPLKDKKGISIVNAFQKIISEGRKPNKIWVDQGSEFYNNSFKDFLKMNNIEMYSTYNEGKLVAAERFIRTLKNRIFKHMTVVSKNVNFDAFGDIINKYNSTVHRTIKMKPIDVTPDCYAKYNGDPNKKILSLKLVIVLELQSINIFLNWSEEVLVVSKTKNAVPWTYAISDLNSEEITGRFYEKEFQKTNQEKFRIEKVIKRKGDKL